MTPVDIWDLSPNGYKHRWGHFRCQEAKLTSPRQNRKLTPVHLPSWCVSRYVHLPNLWECRDLPLHGKEQTARRYNLYNIQLFLDRLNPIAHAEQPLAMSFPTNKCLQKRTSRWCFKSHPENSGAYRSQCNISGSISQGRFAYQDAYVWRGARQRSSRRLNWSDGTKRSSFKLWALVAWMSSLCAHAPSNRECDPWLALAPRSSQALFPPYSHVHAQEAVTTRKTRPCSNRRTPSETSTCGSLDMQRQTARRSKLCTPVNHVKEEDESRVMLWNAKLQVHLEEAGGGEGGVMCSRVLLDEEIVLIKYGCDHSIMVWFSLMNSDLRMRSSWCKEMIKQSFTKLLRWNPLGWIYYSAKNAEGNQARQKHNEQSSFIFIMITHPTYYTTTMESKLQNMTDFWFSTFKINKNTQFIH